MIKGLYKTKLSFGLRLAPPFSAIELNATAEPQHADLTVKSCACALQTLNYSMINSPFRKCQAFLQIERL